MINTKSLALDGLYSHGNLSSNGYGQGEQELKEQILRDACTLLGQIGEFLTRSSWMECEIQINQSGISYAKREQRREKVYNKLLQIRRRFAVFLSNAYNCNMTVAIDRIRAKFAREAFEFSLHATDQTILRGISVGEIREAIQTGEIIEDYPDDKYGPSCLILGFTETGRPLHIQCSYPRRPLIKIVTVYEPDPTEWINYRERR